MSQESPPRPSLARRVWRRIVHGFAVVGVLMTVYHAFFHVSVIVSPSMSPTLQGDRGTTQDWVLSERLTLWFRSPRRWEVVEFNDPDGDLIMKRVAGRPGESIAIKDGGILVDGARVAAPAGLGFLHYYGFGPYGRGDNVSCGTGYFVLGDDSKDSDDSRYNGPLAAEEVRYRAWLRVWPPSRFGFVNP